MSQVVLDRENARRLPSADHLKSSMRCRLRGTASVAPPGCHRAFAPRCSSEWNTPHRGRLASTAARPAGSRLEAGASSNNSSTGRRQAPVVSVVNRDERERLSIRRDHRPKRVHVRELRRLAIGDGDDPRGLHPAIVRQVNDLPAVRSHADAIRDRRADLHCAASLAIHTPDAPPSALNASEHNRPTIRQWRRANRRWQSVPAGSTRPGAAPRSPARCPPATAARTTAGRRTNANSVPTKGPGCTRSVGWSQTCHQAPRARPCSPNARRQDSVDHR